MCNVQLTFNDNYIHHHRNYLSNEETLLNGQVKKTKVLRLRQGRPSGEGLPLAGTAQGNVPQKQAAAASTSVVPLWSNP